MSEYRQDPLSRRWVIVGGDRARRPNEFIEAASRARGLACPFCCGHEAETPPAIATYGSDNTAGWLVRVIPNKFPAVTSDDPVCPTCQPLAPASNSGPVPGFGQHEVIIESPRHVASLSQLTAAEVKAAFAAYCDRMRQLKSTRRFQYVQIFKNSGPAAGASLEHVHSQLIALPGVPEVMRQELLASRDFFQREQKSLLLDMLERELADGERVVVETPNFVAFCPYASRFAYEVWVVPRAHRPRFENAQAGELDEAAQLMRELIGRIENAVGHTAYNYFLHTAPFDASAYDYYHWHIEIIPRLTKVAGFEWSTGCFINPDLPEAAAAHLRECQRS